MNKNRKIVVTGGNGFIGSQLLDSLIEDGARVLNISRSQADCGYQPDGCEYLSLDLRERDRVAQKIREFGPESIYHLASRPDNKEDHQHAVESIDDNTIGTLNLLNAFSQTPNAQTFVYGDSVKVYGNTAPPYTNTSLVQPNSSYAISKLAGWSFCELYSQNNDFNVVSVRPTLVYGRRQPMNIVQFVVESVLRKQATIELMGGTQTRTPLYIKDAVSAYTHAEQHARENNSKIMVVGGETEVSIYQLARKIVKLMASDIVVQQQEQNQRETEIQRSHVDLARTYEEFLWQPKCSLELGLRNTIEAIVSERQAHIVKATSAA